MVREKRLSCTTCRQSKLRCDWHVNYPAPCSRCKAKEARCEIQSTFKRSRMRGRLEELTRENEFLKKNQPPHDDPTPVAPEAQREAAALTAQELDGLLLSRTDVSALVNHFLSFYHAYLPVVDLEQIEILEPLLLWTIILISSQHHPDFSSIFPALRESHRRLLEQAVFANEYTYSTIQALLLLSIWPLPVLKQSCDPSWRYCNLALAAAQQLGLHRPGAQWEYSKFPAPVDTSVKIWTACVFVTTNLALDLGLPCPVDAFNHDLVNASLAEPVLTHVQIQQCIRYHFQNFPSTDPFFSDAAIRASMRDLEKIRAQKCASWKVHTQLEFLGARLKIYLHHLQVRSNPEDQNHLYTQMWYSTLEVALKLSDTMTSLVEFDAAGAQNNTVTLMVVYALPKHYFYILVHSAFAILKFLALHISISEADREKAQNGIRTFYNSFQKLSRRPDDEYARVGQLLYLLARAEQDRLLIIGTTAKTRSATSLVIDAVRARNLLRERNCESSALASCLTTKSDNQDTQFQASRPTSESIFPWDTVGMQGMNSWTDGVFEDLLGEPTSSDSLRGLWSDETGISFHI